MPFILCFIRLQHVCISLKTFDYKKGLSYYTRHMGKEGKNISMDTLVRIYETLDCGILDVIELASDEPSVTEKRKK